MSRPFLDTNVLLYSLTGGDRRQAVAVRLLATGGTVGVRVLNEFASVAHRKMKLSWREVSKALADIRALCSPPVALTLAMHEEAVRLATRDGIAFYNALIVAAAGRWDADERQRDGQSPSPPPPRFHPFGQEHRPRHPAPPGLAVSAGKHRLRRD